MYTIPYRLAYAVWLLQDIIEKYPSDKKLHIMYDIACVLTKHLEVSYINCKS